MGRQIVIDVTLQAAAGKANDLAQLMNDTQRLSQMERGCISYRFTRDLDDTGTFYAFEIWADERAIRDHAAAPPFVNFKRRLPDLGRVISSTWRAGILEPFALIPVTETDA